MPPKNQTVRFDVGGKPYTVSRSLIESFPDSMLARMVSETWQPDQDEPLFLERNGERFQYCLDYMRDNAIDLPMTVSKAAILKDLKYLGMEIDPSKVKGGDSVGSMVKMDYDHVNTTKSDWEHCKFARECFLDFCKVGQNAYITAPLPPSFRLPDVNKHLAKYGLELWQQDQQPKKWCVVDIKEK